MANIRVLVAAAGRGTRAGLPYPKTLFPVQGIPILHRLLDVLSPIDAHATIVVSPAGEALVRESLLKAGLNADLVVQTEPRGMGDAVLQFERAPAFATAEHVLLAWGDVPFLQPRTVSRLVQAHLEQRNDFSFATRVVENPYTLVSRDACGRVTGLVETRENSTETPSTGERDIGLFIFRKDVVLPLLREDLPGRYGRTTGEHGFLYVVEQLIQRHARVEALPVADATDLVSLNSMRDIEAFL